MAMHVPRFWEKANAKTNAAGAVAQVGCWGWSETSPDEARRRAAEAAQRLADRWLGADLPHSYGYDERLPREEIIDEFEDPQGQTKAFVTRNSHGSLILNTRDLMFIDVDFPVARPPALLPNFLARLIGKAPPPVDPESAVEQSILATAQQHPELGFRIYRTRNGFRVVVSNQPIIAPSAQAQELLGQFQADPLYVRMCKNQECFRARLTPKAWRCGLQAPPARFPFADPSAESANRAWEQAYHDKIAGLSSCQFVQTIGNPSLHPAIADLVELHDGLTKANSSDPLA
jgi:hypothetical protein